MTPDDFQLYSSIVRKRSGLFLTPEKAYLLESRLLPIARKRSLASLEEMAKSIRQKPEEALLAEITEAMTTNESSFFRDQKPFDYFRKLMLPRFLKSRASKKHLRIWSAASSSGQEAYSLAMLCNEEAVALKGWTVEIIGTDFSGEMVKRAKNGIYTQFEVQRGLPATLLVKYFSQLSNDQWQISENIRKMVSFRTGNLLESFSTLGKFDIIFCRNVLIYFEREDKARVLNNLHSSLATDGNLLLGGAETVLGLVDKFKPLSNYQGLYVPKEFEEEQLLTA
jgi:chemotaxis protein methyltransferase CheR